MEKELTGVKINSLVDIISYYQPETLMDLKVKYGYNETNKQLLTPGLTLGENTLTDAQLYLEVAEKALESSKRRVQPNIVMLRKRLRNAKRLRTIGQIVAAVTSVGLITALFSDWPDVTKITAAIINFVAVVCTVLADNLESPLHGGSGNLIELYETLVRVDIESDQLLMEFEIYKKASVSQEIIMKKVSTANSLVAKLLESEKFIWG